MALISDRAIVLRRFDYSETSQILALFTREHGQVRVIAKGIKRSTRSRFAVGIDLLEVGQVVWSARADRPQNLAILTEWKQVDAFVGLRERLERLYAAQYAAEVTAELTVDQDPHPTLFDALQLFLGKLSVVSFQSSAGPRACPGLNSRKQSVFRSAISKRSGDPPVADPNPNSTRLSSSQAAIPNPESSRTLVDLCEFQRALLIEIGLMPQGENCVGCRSAITPVSDATKPLWRRRDGAEGVYFTSHEGGLLCRDCEASYVEKRPVSAGAIRVLSGGPVDQSSVVSCQSSVVSSESSVLSPEPSVLDSLAGEVFALLNYHISHLMHKEPRLAKFVLAD